MSDPYQYLGVMGNTWGCLRAIQVILSTAGTYAPWGDEILPSAATLITNKRETSVKHHAFVFWDWLLEITIVPSGFASGYLGESPYGLAVALKMLLEHDIRTFQLEVSDDFFDRINSNRLSEEDLTLLQEEGRTWETAGMFHEYLMPYLERLPDEDDYATTRSISPERIPWERIAPELVISCKPLAVVDVQAALGAAFRVLKSELVQEFQADTSKDGTELVNSLFGNNGSVYLATADSTMKERILRMRDLLQGMYGLLRNRYIHSDDAISVGEAVMVLRLLTWVIAETRKFNKPVTSTHG